MLLRFTEEIVSVPIKTKKGVVDFSVDEHPRPDVTTAGMAKLPTVFKKNGTVTAANASGNFSPLFQFEIKKLLIILSKTTDKASDLSSIFI